MIELMKKILNNEDNEQIEQKKNVQDKSDKFKG